jgi:hypothetical protein
VLLQESSKPLPGHSRIHERHVLVPGALPQDLVRDIPVYGLPGQEIREQPEAQAS